MFKSTCSAANTNIIKRFTLKEKKIEVNLTYATETSATISIAIDGVVVNLLGTYWIPGNSGVANYVNTSSLTMQTKSYFETFTEKFGYKISAILVGSSEKPSIIFSIKSYKLI